MEEFLYEARPYICTLIGVGAIFMPESLGRVCGLVLVLVSLYIWRKRHVYRRHPWVKL